MPELNLVLLGPRGPVRAPRASASRKTCDCPTTRPATSSAAAVRDETELGASAKEYMDRGDLVPDEVIVGVIAERIDSSEALDGFILDGFPRTDAAGRGARREARPSSAAAVTAVLLIDVSDDEVVAASAAAAPARRTATSSTSSSTRPKQEGVCDIDGSPLIVRDDDKPEVIRNRLDQYHEKTEPLVDYYDERSVLRRIDGEREPDEVAEEIRADPGDAASGAGRGSIACTG